ncbi:MAG: asparagine synthase [Lutibacter sp.]|nr:asparagine synthase [Lutibacter sp.]
MPSFVKSKLIPYSYNNTPSVFKDYFFQYASSLGEEGRERFFSFIKDYKGNATDYEKIISIFTEKEKNKLNFNSSTYQPGLRFVEQNFKLDSNLFNKMTRFDLNMFLRHLLLKTDKMTMAHGLESRVPFLDHRVVSLGFSLPPSLKMNLLNEKYLLKKSMVNILPSRVIKRKKQRFFVPIDYWFETVLKEQSSNILLSNQTLSRGLFKGTEVENLLNKYKKSPLYYSRQLWSLLNFEIWARIYLDQEKIGLDQILSLKIIG